MTVIPCCQNVKLKQQIEDFAEVLRTEAHTLGSHGLSEEEFYSSGLFRGAIERLRGQFSATMQPKREFVQHVLNHLEDENFVLSWEKTEDTNRNDYVVTLKDGRKAVIDLKGCLDGNNTTFSERPDNADEFVIWSICTNRGNDPRKNAWSGIHTRLSADIIASDRQVDGLIFWDMDCATTNRACPKSSLLNDRRVALGPFKPPPPCIYVLPASKPQLALTARAQSLEEVGLLEAFSRAFGCYESEISFVDFLMVQSGDEMKRQTTIRRDGTIQKQSNFTPIRRV